MIKQQIKNALTQALSQCAEKLQLQDIAAAQALLNVERPRQGNFGDYAINISPLAKLARMGPPQIAAIVLEHLANEAWILSVTGGFINFQINEAFLINSLVDLVHAEKPGQNTAYADMRCLMEFVSANPTGPLHIGHGRWVALGDSLSRLFQHCGAMITKEFYINDAGSQMFNIANTLWYRCLEKLQTGGKLPEAIEGQPYPFYAADYAMTLAEAFLEQHQGDILTWDSPSHQAPAEAIDVLSNFARTEMLKQQQALLTQCRLEFDSWFSERQLHVSGQVVAMVETLKQAGVTYEQDGALWLASSRFGDDQDRVLIKSDSSYTYLTADIAYHDEKYRRDNGFYNHFINIWGADHHGYIARMKAALQALGHDACALEIILGQLVNLLIDGERTRMGKRKKMLTLEDLMEEVGVDAVRYWMVSKSQDTTLDFNVTLAASSSEENPVFYVQYAHARCASILRNAFLPRLDVLSQETQPALLDETAWSAFLAHLAPQQLTTLFSQLENEPAQVALRELLLKLDSFEDRIIDAARLRAPHTIARYLQDIAGDFHRFYAVCRILVPDANLAETRLVVIAALKKVLAQGLELLGVSAPEKM